MPHPAQLCRPCGCPFTPGSIRSAAGLIQSSISWVPAEQRMDSQVVMQATPKWLTQFPGHLPLAPPPALTGYRCCFCVPAVLCLLVTLLFYKKQKGGHNKDESHLQVHFRSKRIKLGHPALAGGGVEAPTLNWSAGSVRVDKALGGVLLGTVWPLRLQVIQENV